METVSGKNGKSAAELTPIFINPASAPSPSKEIENTFSSVK